MLHPPEASSETRHSNALYLGTTDQENQFSVAECHSLRHNSQCTWSSLINKDKAEDLSREIVLLSILIISTIYKSVLFPGQDCTQAGYLLVWEVN